MSDKTPPLILVPTAAEAELLFSTPPTGRDPVAQHDLAGAPLAALCGFGLAAAGAGAAWHIARVKPPCCLLVGAAGVFEGRAQPGDLLHGSFARLHGVGAGRGREHVSAAEMPFEMFPDLPGEPLELSTTPTDDLVSGDLVTVTAASNGREEAQNVAGRFRLAIAEDMESWSVAVACTLSAIPLVVIRAATNVAGNRNHEEWCMDEAMARLREALPAIVAGLP